MQCRRELATILLEDPDNRLRVSHAQALLQLRLSLAAPPTAALESALVDAAPILRVQHAAHETWHAGMVCLDAAALAAAVAGARGAVPAVAPAAGKTEPEQNEETRLAAAVAVAWPDAEVRLRWR
jgi:hypothetical protein